MFSIYLFIFNLSSFFITLLALYTSVLYFQTSEHRYITYTCICQTFFLLELLNCKLGLSKSRILPTVLQLSSRLYIIWVICFLHSIPSLIFTTMCIAWYISDASRYFLYLTRMKVARFIRYNLFMILYPVGALHEIFLIGYVARLYMGVARYMLCVVALGYVPGFMFLFKHMLKQRASALKLNEKSKKKVA